MRQALLGGEACVHHVPPLVPTKDESNNQGRRGCRLLS